MRRFSRYRPSPAMVVACLALLVALGGTSIAAVSQLVARNSVGTAQLKNNAVTSFKVKNRSLRAADFAEGQIPSGPAGPAGPKGDTGEKGDRGNIGPSDAYSRSVTGAAVPGQTPTTIASLSIPQAGKYVIWGKAYFERGEFDPQVTVVGCDLRAGGDADVSYVTHYNFASFSSEPVTLTTVVVHEFSGAGSADLVCTSTASVGAGRARVTAIRVANLTSTG